MKQLRIYVESLVLGVYSIAGNLTRTTLSLLGVAVGVFCVSSVLLLVESLEKNIRNDLSFVQGNTLYLQKWPWSFGANYPWWKYLKWPGPTYEELRILQENIPELESAAYVDASGNKTVIYKDKTFEGSKIEGTTPNGMKLQGRKIALGRSFTNQELQAGANVAVLGFDVADQLFGRRSPIGMNVSVSGKKLRVIGVMEKQGMEILDGNAQDDRVIIPYPKYLTLFGKDEDGGSSVILLRPKEATTIPELEGLITAQLRLARGIRPGQENNFALNRSEQLSDIITEIFSTIGTSGTIIGIFALLVGGVGIANIMFVSVKERTPHIGIQKAIGAKNEFILVQYVTEAIILCLLGGAAGLVLVYGLTLIPQDFLTLFFTPSIALTGFGLSTLTGLLAGLFPAFEAARLKPVEAIRQGI